MNLGILADFMRERDALLLKLDVDGMRELARRWKLPYEPETDLGVLIAMHKARTFLQTMPPEVRRESRAWLLEQGYRPWSTDDGDG